MSSPVHDAEFVRHPAHDDRMVVGCSCGWLPKKPAERSSMAHVSYLAHLRSLGLPKPADVEPVFSSGPAKGMTFWQWYASGSMGLDPFTGVPLTAPSAG